MTDENTAETTQDTEAVAADSSAQDGAAGTDTQASDAASTGDNGTGDGDSNKSGNSMLDALGDTDGLTFDFTTGEQPEGFPDEYWDAESNSVNAQALFDGLQKQEKIAKDLRAKMGKGEHKPPEKAQDYKLELSEDLQAVVPTDDPLLEKARERAHAHGMSQEAFQGFVSEIIGDMAELAASNADENSPANEAAREQYIKEQIEAIGPNGPQVLRSVQAWGNELLAEGTLSEDDVQTLQQEGLTSAKMVQLFNRLRSRMGGSDIPINAVDDGLPPDAEIADMVDKAYSAGDQAQIAKVEQILDKRRKAGRPERLQF